MSTLNDFGPTEPTFIANIPLQKSPRFLFVTISNPDEIRDPTKQTTIRRHAKRDADRARKRRHKFQAGSLMLERGVKQSAVSYPRVHCNTGAEQATGKQENRKTDAVHLPTERPPVTDHNTSPELLNNEFSSLDFLRPLGAGRGFNPLASYPVEPSSRKTQLLDYLSQSGELQHHPMRAMWITIAMSYSCAFHVTLAHASSLLSQEHNQWAGETTESIKYYTISVHAVNKWLQDPVDSTSDGVIAVILGLTCLDITLGNWYRWQLHMSGLQRILQLRGGAQSLQTSYILQVTAFWNDVTGSLVLDTIPRFPIPHSAIEDPEPRRSHRISIFSQKWNAKFPDLSDIIDGLASLASLAGHIDNRRTNNGRWQDELFVVLKAHPVAHKLLSMSRFTVRAVASTNSSGLVIREMLRLASLLFIGLLKDQCRVFPTGVPENKLRLASLLTEVVVDWSSFMDLRLWVLTVSALAEEGNRGWYVSEIAWTMNYLDLTEWDDALKILKELIWIGGTLDKAADALGTEVAHFRVTLGSFKPSNL